MTVGSFNSSNGLRGSASWTSSPWSRRLGIAGVLGHRQPMSPRIPGLLLLRFGCRAGWHVSAKRRYASSILVARFGHLPPKGAIRSTKLTGTTVTEKGTDSTVLGRATKTFPQEGIHR